MRTLHLRLTPKLILLFVLFAAILLALMGFLAYRSGRAGLEAATTSELLSTAVEKEAALTKWVNDRQSDLAAVAASPQGREDLVTLIGAAPGSAAGRAAHDRLVLEWQTRTGKGLEFLSLFGLEPVRGKIIISTDAREEGTFKEDRAYFVNGKTDPVVQNPYYSLDLQSPAMVASMPILDADGQLIAVLAGRLNLDEMSAIVNRHADLQQTNDAFLVNTSNLFVTQPRFISDPAVLQRGVHTEAVNRCLTGQNGVIAYDDYRGVPAIAVYRWLPERQLCLVVKVDQAEAFEPIQSLASALTAIGSLVLLVGALLAVLLTRMVTRPILALQEGVIRFGQGDLAVRLPDKATDELGTLARQFNVMAAALAEKDAQLHSYANLLEVKVEERTAALKASEGELRALFAAMTDAICVLDADGRYRKIAPTNPPRQLKPDPGLIGKTLSEIFPSAQAELVLGSVQRALATRQAVSAEYALMLNGMEAWFSATVSPLSGDSVIWVLRDITERKWAEDALRESEGRYRSLFENMLNGFAYCKMLLDPGCPPDFVYLEVNSAFETLTGLKHVVGKKVSEVIPGIQDTDPALLERYSRVAATGQPETFETYVESLALWFSISVYSPETEFFVAVFDVITERKRAEAAVNRYAQRMRILHEIDTGLIQGDSIQALVETTLHHVRQLVPCQRADLVILDEPTGEALIFALGIESETTLGQGVRVPIPPDLVEGYDDRHVRVFDDIRLFLETRPRAARLVNEGLLSALSVLLMERERVVGVLGFFADTPGSFTAEHQEIAIEIANQLTIAVHQLHLSEALAHHAAELEQRVLQRTAQLETANKELEAFSYSVSHDLRAPLRGIDGYSRILLREYASLVPEDGQRRLQALRDMAQHMSTLIDDLLAFSRLNRQSLQKQRVDMGNLVNEVLEDLKGEMAQRQVEMVVGELPDCQADLSLLKQVLVNLLSNAFKYTRPRAVAHIEVGTLRQEGTLVYFVRDNGVGFDMRYVEKLFGVFQRLHRADEFEGTGVGLAIVQRIINRHGGRVWAEAALDAGASFYFTVEGDIANDGR